MKLLEKEEKRIRETLIEEEKDHFRRQVERPKKELENSRMITGFGTRGRKTVTCLQCGKQGNISRFCREKENKRLSNKISFNYSSEEKRHKIFEISVEEKIEKWIEKLLMHYKNLKEK